MIHILPFRTHRKSAILSLVILLSLAIVTLSPVLAVEPDPDSLEQEHSKQAESMVKLANVANETTLRSVSIPEESIKKILAHRSEGKTFTSIGEVQRVSGMKWAQISEIMKKYQIVDRKTPQVTTSRDAKMKSLGMRTPSTPEEPGTADPAEGDSTTPVPFTDVRAGYFGQLPGYEHIHEGDPLVKQEFLTVVNRERCQCGCQNETLAYCLVNDPGCPIVKARVKKVYDDILKKAAEAEAASRSE